MSLGEKEREERRDSGSSSITILTTTGSITPVENGRASSSSGGAAAGAHPLFVVFLLALTFQCAYSLSIEGMVMAIRTGSTGDP